MKAEFSRIPAPMKRAGGFLRRTAKCLSTQALRRRQTRRIDRYRNILDGRTPPDVCQLLQTSVCAEILMGVEETTWRRWGLAKDHN